MIELVARIVEKMGADDNAVGMVVAIFMSLYAGHLWITDKFVQREEFEQVVMEANIRLLETQLFIIEGKGNPKEAEIKRALAEMKKEAGVIPTL